MGCSGEKTQEGKKAIIYSNPVCRMTIELTKEYYSITSIDDEKLVLGGREIIDLYDPLTKSISTILKGHNGRINCMIKLSNGNLASGGQDGIIKVWDLKKMVELFSLKGHKSIIWDIREIADNKLISGSDDNKSKIWDLKKKKEILELCGSHRQISSIAVLKNNKVVLASGKHIFLYNLKTKNNENCMDIKNTQIWAVKELANGDVAVGLGNGGLYTVKVTDELAIKTKFIYGHKKTINYIIELDNHKMVTSSDENDMVLWEPNEPDSMNIIKGHTDMVTCICFIRGTKFVSISKDNTLKFWE